MINVSVRQEISIQTMQHSMYKVLSNLIILCQGVECEHICRRHDSSGSVGSIVPENSGKKYCSMDHLRLVDLQRRPGNHDPGGKQKCKAI